MTATNGTAPATDERKTRIEAAFKTLWAEGFPLDGLKAFDADGNLTATLTDEAYRAEVRKERGRRLARAALDAEERAQREPLTVLSPKDLHRLGTAEPLVGDLLYARTLAQMAGAPGSYKSFIALAIAACLAAGVDLDCHKVPQRGRVVYIAAEGAFGLEVRLRAWADRYGVDFGDLTDWLHIVPAPVQLGDEDAVTELCEVIAGIDPALIVIDTRAKTTVGMRENDATEQGVAIAAVERIMAAGKCAALVIHHTGKDQSQGGRGSNAWDGGVWSDLRLTGGGLMAEVDVVKHKDAPTGSPRRFRLIETTIDQEAMPGRSETDRTTLVAVPYDGRSVEPSTDTRDAETTILDLLRETAPPEGLTAPMVMRTTELPHRTVYRTLKRLVESGRAEAVSAGKRGATRYR